MLAGNERERAVQVGAQFAERARLARIVARDGEAAAEFLAALLEAAHVVALPAVHGDRDGGQAGERRLVSTPSST